MWLTGKFMPDFRTLSDFRKNNIQCMESVFKAFNHYCLKLKILSKSFISIDGSKFRLKLGSWTLVLIVIAILYLQFLLFNNFLKLKRL